MTHFGPVCSGGWKCLRAMLSNSINLNYYHSHWPEEVLSSCSSGPIESQLPFKFGQLILGLPWTTTVVVLKEVNWVEIIARFNFSPVLSCYWWKRNFCGYLTHYVILEYNSVWVSSPFKSAHNSFPFPGLFQPTLTPLLMERFNSEGVWKNAEDVYKPENSRRRGGMQRRGDEMRLN